MKLTQARLLRALISTASVGLLSVGALMRLTPSAMAQINAECFMLNSSGEVVDLSSICTETTVNEPTNPESPSSIPTGSEPSGVYNPPGSEFSQEEPTESRRGRGRNWNIRRRRARQERLRERQVDTLEDEFSNE